MTSDSLQQADVIIIGAGIAGVGLAAHLPADIQTIILEAEDHPGYHSTGRTAAIFIQNYGNDVIRQLSKLSRPFFDHPDPQIFEHELTSPRGRLFIETEANSDDYNQLMALADGLALISPEDAVKMVPILKEDQITRAAYEADTCDLDVSALHQNWLKAARKQNTSLVTKASVTSIARDKRLWVLNTPSGVFSAPIIVDAAGAWADQIAKLAGVAPLGIHPHRRSIAVVPDTEHALADWPSFCSVHNYWYAKSEHSHLLISPSEEDPVPAQDAYVDDMVLAEGLYRFEQDNDYPITRVERSWAGLRSFAADRSPVVGFDPEMEGFFWLAGQGGYGIQTAPALSELAASLLLNQQPDLKYTPDLISGLSPARF